MDKHEKNFEKLINQKKFLQHAPLFFLMVGSSELRVDGGMSEENE